MKMLRILVFLCAVAGSSLAQSKTYPCPIFGLARLPHIYLCDHYVQCVDGNGLEVYCGPGMHFNPQTEQCMSAENAGCTVENFVCPIHTHPYELFYLFHVDNCVDYYLCYNGQPVSFSCGAGYNWNPEEQRCELSSASVCWLYNLECPEGGWGKIPHPSDCRKYFHCENGVRYGVVCRWGYHFDVVSGECVYPDYAQCFDNNTTTRPPTTPWEPETPPTSEISITTTTGTTTTEGGTGPLDLNQFCLMSEVGVAAIVPHPERCYWFISCLLGVGNQMECLSFQIFYNGSCVLGDRDTCTPLNP